MKSVTDITFETNSLLQIRGMVEVYEELAAIRLSKIREDIIKNREFFERLEQLATAVGSDTETAYANAPAENRQTTVLVTANEGLYGDLIEHTFRQFLTFIETHPAPIFVIGKMGAQLMHDAAGGKQFTLIPLSDTAIDEAALAETLTQLSTYRTVNIFYGKFRSIATQNPVMSTITGETAKNYADTPQTLAKKHLMYLYEPSIADVSLLFGTEIKASVLNQVLQESLLAKHASRMMHLDTAIERMDEQLKTLADQKRASLKKITERKQQARIAGLMARGGI